MRAAYLCQCKYEQDRPSYKKSIRKRTYEWKFLVIRSMEVLGIIRRNFEMSHAEDFRLLCDGLCVQIFNTVFKLLILGDFNAVSGESRISCESVVGNFGSGSINDNSSRLPTTH